MTRLFDSLKGQINGIRNSDIPFAPRAAVLSPSGDLLIEIYGDIGASWWGDGITAQQIADALKMPHSSVTVRINSPGGDAFEGIAIYNLLKADGKPVSVFVDGLAASAASVIAMAGDTVTMNTGTMLMIHAAMMLEYGNSVDMRAAADLLEKATGQMADIYAANNSATTREAVLSLLYAETWMTPDEAIEFGFADEVQTGEDKTAEVAGAFNLAALYGKTPEALRTFAATAPGTPNADLAVRELELYGERCV